MRDELFKELLESLEQGAAILAGEKEASRMFEYPEPDAGSIRKKLGLTQAAFAALLGISQRTLEGWEQGRRKPVGPARRLLEVAAAHPEAFMNTAQKRSAQIIADGPILMNSLPSIDYTLVQTNEWEAVKRQAARARRHEHAHIDNRSTGDLWVEGLPISGQVYPLSTNNSAVRK